MFCIYRYGFIDAILFIILWMVFNYDFYFSFSLFLCDLILSCSGVLELLSGDIFVCICSIFSLFDYHEVYTKCIYDSLFSVDNFKCLMNPYIFFLTFFFVYDVTFYLVYLLTKFLGILFFKLFVTFFLTFIFLEM